MGDYIYYCRHSVGNFSCAHSDRSDADACAGPFVQFEILNHRGEAVKSFKDRSTAEFAVRLFHVDGIPDYTIREVSFA